MDHIRANTHRELPLPELARVAGFSPYHFHRVFSAVAGETVAAFTRRARLERAVSMMRGGPHKTLSSIAAEVGFATPSEFSRVFRHAYGRAPSTWDRRSRLDGGDDFVSGRSGSSNGSSGPAGGPFDVAVRKHPPCELLYVRVQDPWRGDHLTVGYRRLLEEAERLGIPSGGRRLLGLSWESDKATPLERLTYDLALAVQPGLPAAPGFGLGRLPAMTSAEVACSSLPEVAMAWDHLYEEWLPGSGFEPVDLPAIKRFRRCPEVLDVDAWLVDCTIPLRPSRP